MTMQLVVITGDVYVAMYTLSCRIKSTMKVQSVLIRTLHTFFMLTYEENSFLDCHGGVEMK